MWTFESKKHSRARAVCKRVQPPLRAFQLFGFALGLSRVAAWAIRRRTIPLRIDLVNWPLQERNLLALDSAGGVASVEDQLCKIDNAPIIDVAVVGSYYH